MRSVRPTQAPPPTALLWRVGYRLLLWCAWPVLLLRLWWRGRKLPALRAHWAQRHGWCPRPHRTSGIWIHAVSAGEVVAAALLVRELLHRDASTVILLTTMTSTGRERAIALLGDTVLHSYAPYDYPSVVRRFLNRMQPQVAVFIETELWPNTLAACRARGVRTMLANARLSAKSARGYARLGRFGTRMMASLDVIACQFDSHAARFQQLGVDATRLRVTGTLKFDVGPPLELKDSAAQLRANWRLEGRWVWVAGSTHAGEEKILLDAHRSLLVHRPDCLLLLVPRHPERARNVDLRGSPLNVVWRSDLPSSSVTADTQVVIGDRMGDLPLCYALAQVALAQVAFVGGSLISRGGHNPIEPVAAGLPVLIGASYFNFAEVVALLLAADAVQIVDAAGHGDAAATALASAARELFANPERRAAMLTAGRDVLTAQAGATTRVADIVTSLATELNR